MEFLIFGLIAYLLGSIPTAVWIGKIRYGMDIREHGSKNAGATNTFRVLGKKPGILVLVVDIVKGFTAVFIPFIFTPFTWGSEELINIQLVTALAAVFGHVLPVFANFNGGKGVATSLGVVIGVHPIAAGICLLLFMIVFIISKYVSLGAITSAVAFPLIIIFYFKTDFLWLDLFSVFLSAAVIFAHRKNIKRLLSGEESKMNLFKN